MRRRVFGRGKEKNKLKKNVKKYVRNIFVSSALFTHYKLPTAYRAARRAYKTVYIVHDTHTHTHINIRLRRRRCVFLGFTILLFLFRWDNFILATLR